MLIHLPLAVYHGPSRTFSHSTTFVPNALVSMLSFSNASFIHNTQFQSCCACLVGVPRSVFKSWPLSSTFAIMMRTSSMFVGAGSIRRVEPSSAKDVLRCYKTLVFQSLANWEEGDEEAPDFATCLAPNCSCCMLWSLRARQLPGYNPSVTPISPRIRSEKIWHVTQLWTLSVSTDFATRFRIVHTPPVVCDILTRGVHLSSPDPHPSPIQDLSRL